jgi:hypothetical protein
MKTHAFRGVNLFSLPHLGLAVGEDARVTHPLTKATLFPHASHIVRITALQWMKTYAFRDTNLVSSPLCMVQFFVRPQLRSPVINDTQQPQSWHLSSFCEKFVFITALYGQEHMLMQLP